MRIPAIALSLLITQTTPAVADDLAAIYPATIDDAAEAIPRPATATEHDVWTLGPGAIAAGDGLRVAWERAHLVVGHHEGNAMWAALFPDGPSRLVAPAGGGERVRSVWLRFEPSRIGVLFPPGVVRHRTAGPEAAVALTRGRWLAAEKMRSSFHVGGEPVVPPAATMIVDVRTVEGPRRFFLVENDAVTPHEAFATQALPRPAPITRDEADETLDRVATAFASEYAQFVVRPAVDWPAEVGRFRPLARQAANREDLAAVLAALLASLGDEHATVRLGGRFVPGGHPPRRLNGSFPALEHELAVAPTRHGNAVLHARTADGIGYLLVGSLTQPDVVTSVDAALELLRDTRGLVVDLRFNGGGDERLARSIAGRFLASEQTYSMHRVRIGPEPADLSEPIARRCAPRGPWRYAAPVVVLIGPRTFSSAESFALMLAQCPQVTTYGEPTAGSSGNPRTLALGGGLVVNVPRWLDLLPDGTELDGRGVVPEVVVVPPGDAFTPRADPVLAGGLALVREKALAPGTDAGADAGTDADTDADSDTDADALAALAEA